METLLAFGTGAKPRDIRIMDGLRGVNTMQPDGTCGDTTAAGATPVLTSVKCCSLPCTWFII